MFTVILAALVGSAVVFSRLCWVRWNLHRSVRSQFVTLQDQIETYDSRLQRISNIAFNYMVGLSGESNRALDEAHEIIHILKEFSAQVRGLVISPDDTDWVRANELLSQRVLPVTKTTVTSGFRLSLAQNWRERLEQCIQKIGADIFQITELYRKNIKPLNERIPTTVRELVEVGIRPAINRVRFETIEPTVIQMGKA